MTVRANLAAALLLAAACAPRQTGESAPALTDERGGAPGAIPGTGPDPELPPPDTTAAGVALYSRVVPWPEGRTPIAPPGLPGLALRGRAAAPALALRAPQRRPAGRRVGQRRQSRATPCSPRSRSRRAGRRATAATPPTASRCCATRTATATPELRTALLWGLNRPVGMLYLDGWLYVANTDELVRYPFRLGDTAITAPPRRVLELPAGGYNNHWTRNVVANAEGTKLYVTVGSATNVDTEGIDARDPRRAAILELNPDGSGMRVFASGLRNPLGLDWAPGTSTLWTVVNERDGLGRRSRARLSHQRARRRLLRLAVRVLRPARGSAAGRQAARSRRQERRSRFRARRAHRVTRARVLSGQRVSRSATGTAPSSASGARGTDRGWRATGCCSFPSTTAGRPARRRSSSAGSLSRRGGDRGLRAADRRRRAARRLAAGGGRSGQPDLAGGVRGRRAGRVEPAVKVGELREGLARPESARWDPDQQVWFISNINGMQAKDDNGYISRVGKDWRMEKLRFIAGGSGGVTLHAPKGMAIAGDTLWVTDLDAVRGFQPPDRRARRERGPGAARRALPQRHHRRARMGRSTSPTPACGSTRPAPASTPVPTGSSASRDASRRWCSRETSWPAQRDHL